MNSLQEIRVLYVEDDEDDFFLAREFLNDIAMGTYHIEWASTYESGREAIHKRAHDIYLIDFRLGQQSGLDLIKEARDQGFTKPIILLTGLGDREVDIAAMNAGADDYLTKDDISSSHLERAIRYTLNKHEVTSQLHESEERLRDFLDTASDWIWEMNADFRFTSISGRSLEEGHAYYSDDLLGKRHWDLDWINLTPEEWKIHQDILKARLPFFNFEYSTTHSDFSKGYLQINGKPFFNLDGEFLGYRGSGRNVTSEREVELQLHQAQKMEAIGQLTGGIAHDFNNLLSVTIGNIDLLKRKCVQDEKAHGYIESIVRAVDRGSSLTQRLLAFSRKQDLLPQPTAINSLVVGLQDMLRRTLGEMIELPINLAPGTCEALIDSHQFENALINLSINARDAMPNGGVLRVDTAKVTLDGHFTEQMEEVLAGDYIKVTVSDTGAGMSPEVLEKVFEPFFTTKGVGEGSGLGLSMVYGFIKQSKGHIVINSKTGEGTSIELYLPRSNEIKAEQDSKVENPVLPGGSERILVVEDDDDLRDIPAAILSEQGYDVFKAKNGNDAIKLIKENEPFDLVFTDIVLPGGMNGVETAKEIKKIQSTIKILYTSGYTNNSIMDNSDLIPGVTLVKKPYRDTVLLESVRAMLDSGKD